MMKQITFADNVLRFHDELSHQSLSLPEGFRLVNPFVAAQKEKVKQVTTLFYQKYYNDSNPRRLILGSSPARRGTAVTGVPFEDAAHLQKETGISIDKFFINHSSSGFLYEVMDEYGGCNKFYADFYMSFVCPLGIVKINSKGNEVNCNYYENKKLREVLSPFIVRMLHRQITLGIDTSVCYCIGSGENYSFLSTLNEEHKFFDLILPLEHPRFIMQYNLKDKEKFMNKYMNAFCKYKS